MHTNEDLLKLVEEIAAKYNLDAALVKAIIAVESGWVETAMRFEPKLYEKYCLKASSIKPHTAETKDTILVLMATSLGLMQILGSTAQSLGYKDRLCLLLDPRTNIEYGCKYLAYLRDKYEKQYGLKGVISAYNAGKPLLNKDGNFVNAEYVNKVVAMMPWF